MHTIEHVFWVYCCCILLSHNELHKGNRSAYSCNKLKQIAGGGGETATENLGKQQKNITSSQTFFFIFV